MLFQKSVMEIIPKRYSCRSYQSTPIVAGIQRRLQQFIEAIQAGPMGTPVRFKLLATTGNDRRSLRGLGTYGFVRGATGFIAGAIGPGEMNLEDFGYQMEAIILAATDLDLGTCWLGGSFTRSSFARKIELVAGEIIPAVTATGYAAKRSKYNQLARRQVRADQRLPWDRLFFEGQTGTPLSPGTTGLYAQPLEMVRLGPSASNKQPWRLVRDGNSWHFYLRRTPNYGRGSLIFNVLRLVDLQRVDMGIAMCHFELAAHELGLEGRWAVLDPGSGFPGDDAEYVVSWVK